MHKNIRNELKSKFALLLVISLMLPIVLGMGFQVQATETDLEFGKIEAFEQVRREFFEELIDGSDELGELETILIPDEPNIIERPFEDLVRPPISSGTRSSYKMLDYGEFSQGPFNVGDTRAFNPMIMVDSVKTYGTINGYLAAQGQHSNIWVLDDTKYHEVTKTSHTLSCKLTDMTPAKAKDIANIIDGIYERMTDENTGFGAHANVKIATYWADSEPYNGDIDDDGKINFLFYDLAQFDYAGFFSSADFCLPGTTYGDQSSVLDMLHIDINGILGNNPLYYYGTLAHEFQHFLFYMYFGTFSYVANGNFSWINESLADLAKIYYLQPGAEMLVSGRTSQAAKNPYATSSASNYSDFVNFGSLKNYGTGFLLSLLLYKKSGGNYPTELYNYFKQTYPPLSTSNGWLTNYQKCLNKPMAELWGDAVEASVNVGGTGGMDSFSLMYWLFMESFAADGGTIYTDDSGTKDVSTMKLYSGPEPSENLWTQRNFDSHTIVNNGIITLGGYGAGSPRSDATHEIIYKLVADGSSENTVLDITITDSDAAGKTLYYIALKSTGALPNADIYPLTSGTARKINTNGKEAYLFAVTLYRRVTNATVSYSWSAPASGTLTGTVTLEPSTPRAGDTITATVTTVNPSGTYTYVWTRDGVVVENSTNNSYTTTTDDIGKVIKVTVASSTLSGTLTAQTVAVSKMANNTTPSAPTFQAKTYKSVTLTTVANYEYSKDGLLWQDSPIFDNLLPNTEYKFYQREKATNTTAASNISSALTVTTNAGVINAVIPTIDTQPQGITVSVGEAATLSVVASVTDSGTLSYQWYSNSTSSNTGGTPIGGEISASYTPSTGTSGTYYYYVVVTNTNDSVDGDQTASATSNVATVTVNDLVNAETPSITEDFDTSTVNVKQGVTASTLSVTASVGDNGTLSYQWYSNTTASTTNGTSVGTDTASYTPLTNSIGLTYYYVVVTNTNSGVSGNKTATATSAIAAINVYGVPDAPTGVSATAGNAQATISFSAPSNNGGSQITGYTVTCVEDNMKKETGTTSPITVTGLTNGTAYTFTVVAKNAAGDSSSSGASNAVTPKGTTAATDPTINIKVGSTEEREFDLDTINTSPTLTGKTYELKGGLTGAIVSGLAITTNMLKYTPTGTGAVDQTATQVVTISSNECVDFDVTITFKITAKGSVTFNGGSVTSKSYDGAAVSYALPTVTETLTKTLIERFTGTESDNTPYGPSATAPTNAGTYTLTVSVDSDEPDYTGSTSYNFEIYKATLSDPTTLTFASGTASWSAVSNATGYSVQLIKDGVSIGDAITVSFGTSYDFSSAITTAGSGVYTFSVKAIGNKNYKDSSVATSTASYNNVELMINPTSLELGMYHSKTDIASVSILPLSLASSATYSWSITPSTGITLTDATTAIVTVESTDTNAIAAATLKVTVTIGGLTYDKDITVSVTDDTRNFADSPIITGIVVGNASGEATVSWNASNPAADSYTINYGSGSIPNATSPCIVSGLTNGTEYTFTVTAVKTGYNNAVSSSLTATPYLKATSVSFTLSSPSTSINGVAAPSALTVSPTGAGPITYNWTVSPSGAVTFSNSTAAQPTITGELAGDCTITCTVTNTIDNSKVSHSQSLHILNNEAKILSFSLDGYTATIDDTGTPGTISVTVPDSKDITNLIATFTASSEATVKVSSVTQVSGTTQNDFTSSVTYTVTAEDGTNPKDYVVTVVKSAMPQLSSPTTLSIGEGGVASWDSVTSTGYIVQLYRDGIAYGSAVTVDANTTTYDFLTAMRTGGAGDYSIGVTAVGDGTTNINSSEAKGGSFTMYKIDSIATLSSVNNIPVDTAKDSAGLPTTVTVTLNDSGGTKEISVTWNNYDSSLVRTVTLDGTLGTLPNNVLNPNNLFPSVEVTFVPLVNAATPVFTSNLSGSYNYSQNDAATPLSVTASVTDSGNLSYQWYSNTTNNNTGGTLITGAIFENYTPSTATAGTMYYYVIVSNFNSAANGNKTETATSGVASVTVNPSVLPPNSHTITAYAGSGGTITPSGSVIVDDGNSQGFTISANASYAISNVEVDGVSIGSTSSYVFSNVTADHTISATFQYIGGSTPPPVIPPVNPVNPTNPNTPSYTQSNSSSPSSSSTESSSTSTSASEKTTTIYINDQTVNAVITDEGVLKITYTADDVAKHQDKTGEYTISIPKQDNIDISVPVSSLGSDDLVIETEFGTITIPNETLKALQEIYGDTLRLSIVKGSFKITLLDSRGREVRYNDSDNPLTISLPYKRSGGQTATIVAIKKNGDNTTVYPLGVYNDGYVTFDITSTGTYDIINNNKVFNDTSKHWAANYINFVTARELFNGMGNNNFTPDGTMTRAMFATVLARLDGAKISNSNSTYFTDVPKNQWYTGAVEWAAKNGILSSTAGEFRPNADITREEMSVMLYNYIKHKGYKLPRNAQTNGPFIDENDISAWAAAAVKEIQRVGIINGRPGNIFDPKGTATRAEVATIFARFIEALSK